jgi:hypothetical protein
MEHFMNWLSETFSKAFLVFFVWLVIINLDFILILTGNGTIATDLKSGSYILSTGLGENAPVGKYICHFLSYRFFLPILTTFLTISLLSLIMNYLNVLNFLITSRFAEWKTKKADKINNGIRVNKQRLDMDFNSKHEDFIDEISDINSKTITDIKKLLPEPIKFSNALGDNYTVTMKKHEYDAYNVTIKRLNEYLDDKTRTIKSLVGRQQ